MGMDGQRLFNQETETSLATSALGVSYAYGSLEQNKETLLLGPEQI